jgi:hypothetical protein
VAGNTPSPHAGPPPVPYDGTADDGTGDDDASDDGGTDAFACVANVELWGELHRPPVIDEELGFEGRFVTGEATVQWDATNLETGFHFQSDPDGQFVVNGASYVGRERNGAFF